MAEVIGITSTIPVEAVYASGNTPIDLNNHFVMSADPGNLVKSAKIQGFPDTTCSWICGLFGISRERDIKKIITVTGGDCSETIALSEVFSLNSIEVISFTYPVARNRDLLKKEIESLLKKFNIDIKKAEECKIYLDKIRKRVHQLDRLLWEENRALGGEVRLFQLATSDFEGDPELFLNKVNAKIKEIENRKPLHSTLRLGIVGVPPIIGDLYEIIEQDGIRIVFSEVERQFSLPVTGTLIESYYHYTYPYGIYARIEDISREIAQRKIDGIIHYVQAFCYRGIEDIVLRKLLPTPVLTLQGDLPTKVTETMKLRIEAFIDMLFRKKNKS